MYYLAAVAGCRTLDPDQYGSVGEVLWCSPRQVYRLWRSGRGGSRRKRGFAKRWTNSARVPGERSADLGLWRPFPGGVDGSRRRYLPIKLTSRTSPWLKLARSCS